MKVKEVIKNLKHLDPETEIINCWWDHGAFPDVADEDWDYAVGRVDSRMDWSQAQEDIQMTIEYALDMNMFRED